jgi:hypothetical protein
MLSEIETYCADNEIHLPSLIKEMMESAPGTSKDDAISFMYYHICHFE